MSSNPFRKKGSQPDGASRFPPIEAIDTSMAQAQLEDMNSAENKENKIQQPVKSSMREEQTDAARDVRKVKVVKKVRVLSPPDSPEWPSHAPPNAMQGYGYGYTAEQDDPFDGASTDESDRESSATAPTPPDAPQPQQQQGPSTAPPNPFAKTLQDIEGAEELEKERIQEGEALKAANTQGASLDVDAFRRLLLTGKANPDRPPPPTAQEPRAGGYADTSDTMSTTKTPVDEGFRESSLGQQGSQDSLEIQQDEAEESEKRARPPPPPSSRHGRALKAEQKEDQPEIPTDASKQAPRTDINKPLPAAPARASMDGDTDSPFDQEAAGKIPEPELPELAAVASPNAGKKPAPAPPPRRGHARSDTRSQVSGSQGAEELAPPARGEETTPRSSMDSTSAPSRADSIRQGTNAPAPPPPRRPLPGPRQALGLTSPNASTSSIPLAPPPPVSHAEPDHRAAVLGASPPREAQTKTSAPPPPPPPPPARNSSVRRPTSVSSVDGISRRISGESKSRDTVPPPPPPPRQRGSSPSTLEGRPRGKGSSTQSAESRTDILADLTALQREVDALRGKIN